MTSESSTNSHSNDTTGSIPSDQVFIHFTEYDDKEEDMFSRFKVSDAMNQLAACSSLGSNIRNYYRYGSYRDCSAKYDHLKFCLSIKTKTNQVAQIMIQKRDAELKAQKAKLPNSEDVWTIRQDGPPEEFANIYQQSEAKESSTASPMGV